MSVDTISKYEAKLMCKKQKLVSDISVDKIISCRKIAAH